MVEAHYSKMSDAELERIIVEDAQGLMPEVVRIIEFEIEKRKLNPHLLKGIIAQNKEYTIDELKNYAILLRSLPCPICQNTSELLNGTIVYTVKSFLVFTINESKIIIACSSCLNKKSNQAILSTLLLGWWGVPWGLLKTPLYLYRNFAEKRYNDSVEANNSILNFALMNIGKIETYQNNSEKLKELIKYI
jgi:hypothetical protein